MRAIVERAAPTVGDLLCVRCHAALDAMDDSYEQVTATLAAWEQEQGLEPRYWQAIGREERADDE